MQNCKFVFEKYIMCVIIQVQDSLRSLLQRTEI